MTRNRRTFFGLVLGLSLSLGIAGATPAQELPTGAGRVVENVQMRIFISKSSLTNHVAKIVANHPAPASRE